MTGIFPRLGPVEAAIFSLLGLLMDIILHVGAHRTATTSFQRYLRRNRTFIDQSPLRVWTPRDTRGGLFSGLFPSQGKQLGKATEQRAAGRIALALHRLEQSGVKALLVSEENMLGSVRQCLRSGALYPAAGERLARFAAAFDHRITKVVVSIRALDLWWSSAAAYGVSRGAAIPDLTKRETIVTGDRTWRHVIEDVACAMPDAEICVTPHEVWGGRPAALLSTIAQTRAPLAHRDIWVNRAPDLAELREILELRGSDPASLPEGEGRWLPFSEPQSRILLESHQDDLFWLTAGADGIAKLTEDRPVTHAGPNLRAGAQIRGLEDDQRHGRLARSG